MASLKADLIAALGEEAVLDSPSDLEAYGQDWTRVYPPKPSCIALPKTAEQVSAAVRLAARYAVPVVPSGGRTGLAGGAVAAQGELVLALDRLRSMDPVDSVARTVRVGAGAVTAAVHEHCKPHGLTWPVDFASAGSSQVGGNIATNAGGVRVVRYGLTRNWVSGLEVVLPNGEQLALNGVLEKNNTGLDLRQLFIGTEGTLGIITHATLKLTPLPEQTQVALLAAPSLDAVLSVFAHVRKQSGLSLQAFEYFSHESLEVVLQMTGESAPFAGHYPAYLLVELEAGAGASLETEAEAWLTSLFEQGLVEDGVLATSSQEAARLWHYRESISESLTKKGFVYKNDVSVGVSELPRWTAKLEATLRDRYPDFGVYLFGHVGDGNLHVNIMKPDAWDKGAFLDRVHETDEVLFSMLKEVRGSVSAEHGIGLLKRHALSYSRTEAELSLLRAIKSAVDPHTLMNRGKIFE